MVTIRLTVRKTTKNKIVYDHPDFGSLYVPNEIAAQLGTPEIVEMTIAPAPLELAQAA